ncbi:MAG TPA: ribbon-helix-helix protein, CopG family [Micromonosporaceae bacterium]|nr:ribbon-helix-helix protein, CopG family [Micromonosporaceae bacterium]
MTDLLIRDVPDEVIAAIDVDAGRQGLSRSEYLRRALARVAARTSGAMATVDDLRRFEVLFADLANDDVMRQAWR